MLVDEDGAVRTRCRTGSPLLDPILSSNEECKSCPAGYKPPGSWQLAESYYAVHPAPPAATGDKNPPPPPKKAVTVEVVKQLPPQYEVKSTDTGSDGKPRTRTVIQTQTVVKTKPAQVKIKTQTVTVRRPARTSTVTHTVTV